MQRKKTKRYYSQQPEERRTQSGVRYGRLWLVVTGWVFLFLLIAARLVQVQILQHRYYVEASRKYQEDVKEVPARRGSILDRNGQIMAQDVLQYEVGISKSVIQNPQKLARVFSKHLGRPVKYYLDRIRRAKTFAVLERRVSPATKALIESETNEKLTWTRNFSRYYPFKTLASQVVGFCDYSGNQARAGLELRYEEYLKGIPGKMYFLRDARHHLVPAMEYPFIEPRNGYSLETTLDMTYQQIVEDELARGVQKHKAEFGTAILMNPHTGEILAMANYPGFDPNDYSRYSLNNYRNTAISYLYDPGSTFKLVPLTYILTHGLYNLDQKRVDCEKGRFRFRGVVFRDHEPFGTLTVREVFEHSSNIGVAKLSRRFNKKDFYALVRNYGLGMPTGIDLPGEERGILRKPRNFSRVTIPFMSIGYSISVTPLQILNMYAAVANGGKLMQPFVVRRVVDETGVVIEEYQPSEIRQLYTPEVATQIAQVLRGVVSRGTGMKARIDGLPIAGKTGTAQQFDPRTRSYHTGRYVASFVGFFPADQPEFAMIVVLFYPKKGYYGGQVAAPIFRNIALSIYSLREAYPQRHAARETPEAADAPDGPLVVPDVQGMNGQLAINLLEENGFAVKCIGNGNRVWRQEVLEYDHAGNPRKVALYLAQESPVTYKMPDLLGLTMQEALLQLEGLGVQTIIKGHGIVKRQFPLPGKEIAANKRVTIYCEPG